ncbi:uncharacterized protein LOC122617444 [Drosophila teissieri]|uniref:uncharacterized protein LOC122617444 n=1 Tax=Drosophila teissieri TaxID=7243 RepID=UPI001CB9E61B|nr:uncharacterized protein LOC122617444 [Drosophila teissieri]XP_043649235.1 uncharacterized protein LOC122617444 [Drosophila teissieri]
MSSQFREKRGIASSGNKELPTMDPTESDFALELKPAPKQTCIPEHQRQRMASSDTSVYQRESVFDIPDKSWSVLYFGSGKDRPSN